MLPGRSPHGERGLKFCVACICLVLAGSLSSWRAWIEIHWWLVWRFESGVALLMESVD